MKSNSIKNVSELKQAAQELHPPDCFGSGDVVAVARPLEAGGGGGG